MTTRWTKRENDYRGILDLQPAIDPSVAVIIPAQQTPANLARTLAGLVSQRGASIAEVVVVDDRSPESLEPTVDGFRDVLDISYVRASFDGFGAGRARNLGVANTTADVLLFVDSDCIAAPDLVAHHLRWHARVTNAVVVGSRVDVDAEGRSASDIAAGALGDGSFGHRANSWGEVEATDWRRMFYRGNLRLVIDDTAYRAAVSNNLSVTRAAFEGVGGFSDAFTNWSGEDTELGWRLFRAGNFIIPDESAVVFHQVHDDDPEERSAARDRARALNRSLLADLIPNRAYRRSAASTYTAPQLTWLVAGDTREDLDRHVRWLESVGWLDNDVVLVGDGDAMDPWRSRASASDRFAIAHVTGTPTVGSVMRMVRGEFVAMLGAFQAADRSLVPRAMKRFESDRRLAVVRAPYVDASGTTARRMEDLCAFDSSSGFPAFAVARTRALAKHGGETALVEALRIATDVERSALLGNPKLRVAGSLADVASRPDLVTARHLGIREIARMATKSRGVPEAPEPPPSSDRPGVSYIGFTGRDNLGDEAILAAIEGLLPGIDVRREHPDPVALMVGGGTIVNSKQYYLTRLLREDRPGVRRFVFAPGVRDPDYWGVTEPMEDWFAFFRSAEVVTVRGPDSARHLRALGWEGNVDVIGDPALSLVRPDGIDRRDEAIIAPLWTSGNLFGKDDGRVLGELAREAERLASSGLAVTLMSSFPEDDRRILEMERSMTCDIDYLAGYADLDVTLGRIARSRLVVGERLHASILAAAMRTPFAAVAYRPKTLDFARSIDAERWTVRTDDIDRLHEVVSSVLADAPGFIAHLDAAVEPLVTRQRSHAAAISAELVP